ncbi:MAG: IS4 family transposase [Rhodothermales bacterium]
MARTVAGLPAGTRLSDYITLGVIAERIPRRMVDDILREEERESERIRKLPAHVVVYYVIALAIYMNVSYGEVLRCLLEGLAWLGRPVRQLRQTTKSAISHARTRLGYEPMRRLYRELVAPVATDRTLGAWYRSPVPDRGPQAPSWRLVSLDGSTLDVPDETANVDVFGRPGTAHGKSAFPQLRFVSLVECGTHVIFAAAEGPFSFSEVHLTRSVLPQLTPGMLCLADRNFFGYDLWHEAASTGADLLWRVRLDAALPVTESLQDGSFLSTIYASAKDRRSDHDGTPVRVIEYELVDDVGNRVTPGSKDNHYRLLTTILDPEAAPASDLARLYHERWEAENAFDEFKTHLRGRATVLRSRTPALVRQEFYGFLLAHYVIRGLMHEAALAADIDPDEVSFVHSVRVIRRKIQASVRHRGTAPFSPSGNRHVA